MERREEPGYVEIRAAEREARFVLTREASFFVPGTIPAGARERGGRTFALAAMRGEFLGRPIVTIPPEEAA